MGQQVISLTVQFSTDKDLISISELNLLVNSTLKNLFVNSNLTSDNPEFTVKIWRSDG
jgi:hypothetical protein